MENLKMYEKIYPQYASIKKLCSNDFVSFEDSADSGVDSIDVKNDSAREMTKVIVGNKVKNTIRKIESNIAKSHGTLPIYSTINIKNKKKNNTSKELKELNELLSSTNEALERNSNLRASLTISRRTRKSGHKFERKASSSIRKNEAQKTQCLSRQNSVRIAPKTVINLAAKFESMFMDSCSQSSPPPLPTSEPPTFLTESFSLNKKELSQIITALTQYERETEKSNGEKNIVLTTKYLENFRESTHVRSNSISSNDYDIVSPIDGLVRATPALIDEEQNYSILYGYVGDYESIKESKDEENWDFLQPDSDEIYYDVLRANNKLRNSTRASIRSRSRNSSSFRRISWKTPVNHVSSNDRKVETDESYESIYETIRSPSSESEFEEVTGGSSKHHSSSFQSNETENQIYDDNTPPGGGTGGLSKFAEAAGRKMKKLRRHWSLRKNDITRSLSRIKKPNFSSDFPVSRQTRKKNRSENDKAIEDSMFYITLTIEEKGDVQSLESNSTDSSSLRKSHNCQKRRKSSSKVPVVRPRDAPPEPPFKYGSQDSDSYNTIDLGEDTYKSSLFQTEPLYQFYDVEETITAQFENSYHCLNGTASTSSVSDTSQDDDVFMTPPDSPIPRGDDLHLKSRSSAMDLIQTGISNCGGRRTLWAELPEVLESGILDILSREETKLQEALFEVISSEASYLKSLNILTSHFVQSAKLTGYIDVKSPNVGDNSLIEESSVLTKRDHTILFSDILAVRQCSEKFLEDLETKWQESICLSGISAIVEKHAKENFNIYVKYCSNQVYQDRILKKLRNENPKFVEIVKELESSPACQSLAMQSFLMLPMQRITRLPLLMNAIYSRLTPNSEEYQTTKSALEYLHKLVKECNESARTMSRMEEMLILSQQLDFRDVRAVPLISASRWLIQKGSVLRLYWRENIDAKLTFGRSKLHRQRLNLFLFTDLLVITKRKSEDHYLVIDYCPRNLVEMSKMESSEGLHLIKGLDNNISWCTLLQNHENKTIEWMISFTKNNELTSWIEAFSSSFESILNPDEVIYADWDSPKIEIIEEYRGKNSEELSCKIGEIANVLKKVQSTGWYYVEKLNETRQGWIPMSHTKEVESSHVRARNFKQRHAFLKSLSQNSEA